MKACLLKPRKKVLEAARQQAAFAQAYSHIKQGQRVRCFFCQRLGSANPVPPLPAAPAVPGAPMPPVLPTSPVSMGKGLWVILNPSGKMTTFGKRYVEYGTGRVGTAFPNKGMYELRAEKITFVGKEPWAFFDYDTCEMLEFSNGIIEGHSSVYIENHLKTNIVNIAAKTQPKQAGYDKGTVIMFIIMALRSRCRDWEHRPSVHSRSRRRAHQSCKSGNNIADRVGSHELTPSRHGTGPPSTRATTERRWIPNRNQHRHCYHRRQPGVSPRG